MKVIKKTIILNMLMLIVIQVSGTAIFNASEVVKLTSEVSEITEDSHSNSDDSEENAEVSAEKSESTTTESESETVKEMKESENSAEKSASTTTESSSETTTDSTEGGSTRLESQELTDSSGDVKEPSETDTVITKAVVDESGDGFVQNGEVLTYTLSVANPNLTAANNVVVRDSMLEATPSWITLNDDVVVKDEAGNVMNVDTEYSGDLQAGDFTIFEVPANSTMTITYSVRVNQVPEGVEKVSNTATDNNLDPIDPDTNLPLVCGPAPKADVEQTSDLVTSSVTSEEEEKSNSISNFFKKLRSGEIWTPVSKNPEISKTSDLNNTLDMYSNHATSRVGTTEYSSDNWIPWRTEPYMQLEHMGEDVIGEYIRYNDVDFGGSFSLGSAVDIKITIADAVVGAESVDDVQYIAFTNQIGGLYEGGYSRVDYKVEFFKAGTDTPVVVSPLVRFADIDFSQVVGTQTDSTYIVSSDSELKYADNTDGTYFTYEEESVGSDQKHWALMDFGDVSSFTFTYGMNKFSTDPDVLTPEGYTNLDIRLRGNAGQIDVQKVDESGNPLAGAEFTIYDSKHVEKGIMTTNADGYAISNSLLLGDYTVVETKAPEGYVLSDTVYSFSLEENNEVAHVNAGANVVNTLLTGQVELNKVDADGNGLEGVEFTIYDSEGNEVEIVTTDSTGYGISSKLDYGTYTITETKPLAGYALDDRVYTFTIDENNEVEQVNDGNSIENNLVGGIDCDNVELPVDPEEAETKITKSMIDSSGDGLIQGGEVLTYTLEVTNSEKVDAHNVVVRDSMFEVMPSWLTFNDDVTIDPSDIAYSGSLEDGDLTFDVIEAGETVTITYSVTASQPLPSDVTELSNIATDNGQDPTIVDPEICAEHPEDCDEVVTPLDPDEPIIDPGEAETKITKTVEDASGDELIQGGEVLTYTLEVTNPEKVDAHNVVVRDSMFEVMPSWLTFNDDVTINPADIAYSGSLEAGDLTFDVIEAGETVTITYSVTASQPLPSDVTELSNIATDNGQDPTIVDPDACAEQPEDCDEVVTPLDPDEPIIDPGEAKTKITKSMIDSSGDGLIQGGEVLTYTLEVTNSEKVDAHKVVVRDSMLEAMPSWLTFNDDVTIDPSGIAYSGSLEAGDLTFDVIEAGETVTITYSVTASQPLPSDVTELSNIATDNGQDPTIVDPDACAEQPEDCDEVVTPLDPDEPIIDPGEAETEITKSMTDSSGDGLIQGGEVLTYTLEVTNSEKVDAHNVVVRDSMLEAMPSWLTFNDDVTIDPSDIAYSGSLEDGDLTFDVIEAGETVTITYSVTASQPLPSDVTELSNIATDNGQDPTIVDPEICTEHPEDCDEVVTPLDPDEPIIDPGESETKITKTVEDASGDELIQGGEVLTYTLEVTNPEKVDAHNVVVRDSMLEELPSWLTFNDDVTIDPSDIAYSGSLEDGDLTFDVIEAGETVTITYSVTASQPLPSVVTELSNIATDNGQDPTIVDPDACAEQPEDCDEVVTPLDPDEPIIDPGEAKTKITKSMIDSSGDGSIQGGEVLTYTLEVTNPEKVDAHNVVVRDSMLEAMPSWLTFNDDVTIDPSDIAYSGSLEAGDLTFDVIEAGETVTITYSVTASQPLPSDVSEVSNIATDNGQDPTIVDPEACAEQPEDCDEVVTPLDPDEPIIDPGEAETKITKTVADASGDELIQGGEVLTYTLEVTNPEKVDAHNVVVRDSMLEAMPSWLTFNDDVTIDPSDIAYSGSLEAGNLTFDVIEAGETVTITYSVTASQPLPTDVTEVSNIATDNGQDPTIVDPEICTEHPEDCDEVVTPLDPDEPIIDPGESETKITKTVADASGDGLIQGGEILTYTLEVTNPEKVDAHNVVVRDSMLEAMPSWLTYNDDVTINPADIAYSGSLEAGDLTFDVIEAGETVAITYSVSASQPLPSDVSEVSNIATDNGQDPTIVDPGTCVDQPEDCDEVVTPLEGDTVIGKTVTDENGDGIVQSGETLDYSVQVSNKTENDVYDVVVRDSLVENTPEWLTFNDDITIDPSDISYSGSLTNGTLTFDVIEAGETVTITYSFVASDPLETEVENVVNMATDNGQDPNVIDPEVCQNTPEDCAITVTPLEPELPVIDKTEGETEISKSVVDQDGNNILSPGETLTYTVQVANKTENNAYDVNVRDSMIEETPEWLTFNDDVAIDPSDVLYSGSLTTGDLIFDVVEAGQTIKITYSLTAADQLPSDVTEVSNIATDDGQDPTDPSIELPTVCENDEEDCDEVTVPLEGNTKISKSVVDENENGILEANETLTYTIEVLNDSEQVALDTVVRDSMIEDMPSWLTFNDDVTIDPSDIAYSGSLVDGDLTFGVIEAGETVTITYSMTASDQLPSKITEAVNMATDDGQDPSKVKPEVCEKDEDDCAIATIVTDNSDEESIDHHLSVTGGKSLLLLFDLIAIVLTTLSLKIRLSK